MPIYEYECDECGHQFEILQKMSDDKLSVCPECNKPALRKLISAVAFRLKGKGWYETDFKDGSKKNLSSSDSSTGDKKGSSQESGKAEKVKTEPAASKNKEGKATADKPASPTKKSKK